MPLELDLSSIPIWLNLRHVPLELFSLEGLSHIVSVIGTPLYMDRITVSCKRLTYAKMCVEIGVDRDIHSFVKVLMRDGSFVHIGVEVPWYPQKCMSCKVFGHNDKTCYLGSLGED
ncbi:hypothetical protein PTKIN_Ptkin14bG0212400 [Pterospermum kingtungense]